MKRLLTMALCALLAACGGYTSDEDEEEGRATVQPVDCRNSKCG